MIWQDNEWVHVKDAMQTFELTFRAKGYNNNNNKLKWRDRKRVRWVHSLTHAFTITLLTHLCCVAMCILSPWLLLWTTPTRTQCMPSLFPTWKRLLSVPFPLGDGLLMGHPTPSNPTRVDELFFLFPWPSSLSLMLNSLCFLMC